MKGTNDLPDRSWAERLAPYARPAGWRGLFQLANSALPFAALWVLMLISLKYSYWITLALAIPAAGLLVRMFIIQHDCGHGSFFRSRAANDAVGFLIGVPTLTPYGYWKRTHAIHHATSGNLDRRVFGEVMTLTVAEYLGLPWWRRLAYRLYRSPLVLFGVGPVWQFVLKHRFPFDLPRSWKREWASVMWTNLAIAATVAAMWKFVGIGAFLKVQVPITLAAGIAGVWLFYIQHQFEDAYWESDAKWDYYAAGLDGSSYYDLPRVLHWFTGNIGLHHIHHLSSRIPNYRLRKCFREVPELQRAARLTLWSSLKCARLKLWDEERGKLVGFRQAAAVGTASAGAGATRRSP